MSYTYIQLVNEVLVRLREREVTSINDTAYSKLISKFVNDAKRQAEDAYNWNALSDTITAETQTGIFNYVLTGSGQRFRVMDVVNDSTGNKLENRPSTEFNAWFMDANPTRNEPRYYNFNGTNTNGDTLVDIYPIPDQSYTLRFNTTRPQDPLTNNADILLIPHEPVIFGAVARGMAERGEDGGMDSNAMYALYQQSLGDAIALESGRYIEEQTWTA